MAGQGLRVYKDCREHLPQELHANLCQKVYNQETGVTETFWNPLGVFADTVINSGKYNGHNYDWVSTTDGVEICRSDIESHSNVLFRDVPKEVMDAVYATIEASDYVTKHDEYVKSFAELSDDIDRKYVPFSMLIRDGRLGDEPARGVCVCA